MFKCCITENFNFKVIHVFVVILWFVQFVLLWLVLLMYYGLYCLYFYSFCLFDKLEGRPNKNSEPSRN